MESLERFSEKLEQGTQGVREHLCKGGGHKRGGHFLCPPFKPPFKKNIDTFFNYVNYSII